jgi:hypothetical protein
MNDFGIIYAGVIGQPGAAKSAATGSRSQKMQNRTGSRKG